MTRVSADTRAILRLALPALGALVAQPLFLLVDAAVVGTLGTAPLAGLGIAGTVVATLVGLCIFLAYATTSSVARHVGAGNRAAAISAGIDGLGLALLIGIVAGIGLFITAPPLVDALGASPEAAAYAVTYLRIMAIASPATLAVLAAVGVLRGLQDTRTTLLVTLLQVAVNTVLVVVFVLVFQWGVAGSAVGTAIAEAVGLIAYGALLMRLAHREGVRIHPHLLGVWVSARTGFPLFIRTIALRAVFLIAVAAAARMGDATLAAYHVTSTVWFTLALALDALAIAGQALLGKVLGAANRDAARALTHLLVRMSVALGFILTVLIFIVRPWVPQLFTQDAEVAALISSALILVAIQQPLAGAVFAYDGILIGAGDTKWLAFAQTAVLIAFIPAIWLVVAMGWGIAGLWWSIAWMLLTRGVLLAWRARGTAWQVTGPVRN
ncbi:MAG: MATE family efflux transporter [Actinobacteria bacterium]|nr:MATE family efflux transporter [Actinomycetota bacterium]